MPSAYYHQIRRRFVFAVAGSLLVLIALFCWNSLREYRLVISGAEKRSASYVSALKEHAERVFVETDQTLLHLATDIVENGGMTYAQGQTFYKLVNSRVTNGGPYYSVFVMDEFGKVISHSQEYRMKSIDLADRDYFQHHRDNPASGLFISKSYKSRVNGKWRFCFSRSLRDAYGRFIGLVAVGFDTDYFEKFYKTIEVGNNGRIILSTTIGDVLINEPFSEKVFLADFRRALLFKEHLAKASSDTFHADVSPIDRTSRIVSYSKLSNLPVVSIVSFDKAAVVAPWRDNFYKQGTIAALLSFIVVILSILFLRKLQYLESSSQRLEMQQEELALKALMIDSASDAFLLLDEKGSLLQFSNSLCTITGRTRQELEKMKVQDLMPPESADKVEESIKRIFENGTAVTESAYLHTSGKVVPVEGHTRSIKIRQKQLVLSVVRDISTRKEADDKIMTVAGEWQSTFDAIEDAVWLLDINRKIVRANKATQKVFYKSHLDVVGLSCCIAAHDDHAPHPACPFDRMLESKKRASMQMSVANNWFEISVDPVFSVDGTIINAVHIVKDITDLKKAELLERIRSEILERMGSDESLSQLLAFIAVSIETELPGSLCSIMLVDEDGVRLLNGAAPSLPDVYNIAVHRTKIGEGIGSCGTAAFRKERVIVEDIATHPFWNGFVAAEEAGLRSCWSEPIFSSAGQLLGTFAIYHRQPATPGDEAIRVIEQASTFAGIAIERSRNEAERNELEERLSQSQKMEAVGHLAGGVAHDFNNLLTPIIIYADILKRALPDNEKLLPKIEGIINASHKARDLTQQLLSFGRKQVMQMQVIDLNEVISSFYSIMRRTLRENIDIDLLLSSQAAIISADRSKLDQVILNLAINAQDAIEETGEITIETGQVLIDDEYARLHPGMSSGDFILLAFKDNGCGMSDETLRHIFEPFFTTKQVGHGTGLGLANVFGIVKQHNGYIAAISKLGSGTTFKIYFPLVNAQPSEAGVGAANPDSDHVGTETILLVEDNEMVRVMTAELLEGLGYRVYVGEYPEHALELVRQIPEKIDLLITDVVMPGMNGQQLFERINAERPDIERVLYMSGYTNNVIVNAGALEEGIHFLQKPFTVDGLMAKVKGLLHPAE